jgi:C-terminal processing protease CtpA/Prc
VFVAALRTLPQVKLVGTPTSGGSGRAKAHTLPRSRIGLQLSTMASFQPDGKLFESHGIEPDVTCEPAPGDLVGAGDAVLDAALQLLK